MPGPKHPVWTVKRQDVPRGLVFYCNATPMFAFAHLPALPDEDAHNLAAIIAEMLTDRERRESLDHLKPQGGAFWAIDNKATEPGAPVRMDLIGVPDLEVSVTIGPRVPDGAFLRSLAELHKLFSRLENEPEPTHRTHRTMRGRLPRRRDH